MKSSSPRMNNVMWWGRSDVSYARNGVIRAAMSSLEMHVHEFKPAMSWAGYIEASLRSIGGVDVIWVPCFRQRDVASAKKWSAKKAIPMIFDPLISAYDKQVFEREKFLPSSSAANRLLRWEQRLFQMADIVIADTHLHAEYYEETLGVSHKNIHVIPVSAEENLFFPIETVPRNRTETRYRILYYGSYLALHGVETIIEAVLHNSEVAIDWIFIGDGPMRAMARERCSGLQNVRFVEWVEYKDLASDIHLADLVLGVFGMTDKARRVIPNKVYQALACGRPVVTMRADAYPSQLLESGQCGIYWIDAGDPQQLSDAINRAMNSDFSSDCLLARQSYETYFSNTIVEEKITSVMQSLT